jgi:hypothetical protein
VTGPEDGRGVPELGRVKHRTGADNVRRRRKAPKRRAVVPSTYGSARRRADGDLGDCPGCGVPMAKGSWVDELRTLTWHIACAKAARDDLRRPKKGKT